MSCQSLAARAFVEPEKEITHCGSYHRSVRFNSESHPTKRSSNDTDNKRDNTGAMSVSALSVGGVTSQRSVMSQSAPSPGGAIFDMDQPPPPPAVSSCRFPKLEECAHFHYERVSLGGLSIELASASELPEPDADAISSHEGWLLLKVRSHVSSPSDDASSDARAAANSTASWTETSDVTQWTLHRCRDNLLQLDEMLHRCIYDRKVSGLPKLSTAITESVMDDLPEYHRLISDYMHHLSIIADDSINCGPVLNWLQMDNKGHRLLVANEDSSSINTPAVAAGYSVRKYVSQARDEISFDVGDMISIIDMPGPQESLWWRGKCGFRVGFFPHHCVAVIGDKVPRHMTQPPPIVGSVAVAPIKPVLRKHGKLISLFRSFILSRPSRRRLKQQGILKERLFGCDLGEHLLNCGHEVPQILLECARSIESRGAVDGIYRLSGGAGLTQRLRANFDACAPPDLSSQPVLRDPHAVSSLLKMYFRELPNPLCTYQLYESFVSAVQLEESLRLRAVRQVVAKLPPPHYRTLAYLMRHLRRMSLLCAQTGMTARNMAIVWAPNLLRSPAPRHALQGVQIQAVVTEFLICYAEELFAEDQADDEACDVLTDGSDNELMTHVELRTRDSCRRPKSLPLNPPTKLLSLEEARRRGKSIIQAESPVASMRSPLGSESGSQSRGVQLKPTGELKPKYIEVGSGPNNLPEYHTVLERPAGKRAARRSSRAWRALFSKPPRRAPPPPAPLAAPPPPAPLAPFTPPLALDEPMGAPGVLRPVKSCESLASDSDTLPPLLEGFGVPLKHHTRSSSCDSYFEPWQAELAHMRLRLSPQERDHHMFSEEDDTQIPHNMGDSTISTPAQSDPCSVEPSPRRDLRIDISAANDLAERRRMALEEQVAGMVFIDSESPRAKRVCADRSSSQQHTEQAKRVCKDRDSPLSSITDFQTSLANVKLRERSSPRKTRNTSRYSGFHQPLLLPNADIDNRNVTVNSRLSWHGKDGHSTLIKIDWPIENSSTSNLTASTINSNPISPNTPVYDPLESDSEASDANKHTIQIKNKNCENCSEEKCLKCELLATDYENFDESKTEIDVSEIHDILKASPTHSSDVSYQKLNRLSATSTSSISEHNSEKIKGSVYENGEGDAMKIMTSSHESSSSYSNLSPIKNNDELFECFSYKRPNYINLQSSSTSKSSPGSPLKSPLKSTISITFRSPTKSKNTDYEQMDNLETPTNERESFYEDIDLEKNLSIVEEAPVPQMDASLPTQQACQPDSFEQDLIILETPTDKNIDENVDVYSQVKFFRKSIEEVNAMILDCPEKEDRHYENVDFTEPKHDYENINVNTLKICDKEIDISTNTDDSSDLNIKEKATDLKSVLEQENASLSKNKVVAKNTNVRELANRFESPTEQKPPFNFKTEIKYPTLEKKTDKSDLKKKDINVRCPPPISPKTYKLSRNSCNARSLDENAFVKEFGEKTNPDRRRSLEVKDVQRQAKFSPDLNLKMEEIELKSLEEEVTPTTENKILLVQRNDDDNNKCNIKNLLGFDTEKKLSRERIEKYKEERRNFLREKYSSQSFRSNPEQLTKIKIKKEEIKIDDNFDTTKDDLPKFERRNTVDMGQRMRFSLARSANNLDVVQSPTTPESVDSLKFEDVEIRQSVGRSREFDRKEKVSPSYNIKDMAAMFEQKSQHLG